ncbi:MAG: hypothetical protein MZW92_42390 [Comamonadaceae bacterium]|nr:hypothetical protein [Comamonadaceae bacterium]
MSPFAPSCWSLGNGVPCPAAACGAGAAMAAGPQQPIDRFALVTRHNVDADARSTRSRRCRSATASSRSPSTRPACRRSRSCTSRPSRSARCRSGAGTRGRTRTAGTSTGSASRSSTSHGRMVGYADIPGERTPEIDWLRANPHRLHLGRIGFRLTHADGSAAAPADHHRHPPDARPLERRHRQPLPLRRRAG